MPVRPGASTGDRRPASRDRAASATDGGLLAAGDSAADDAGGGLPEFDVVILAGGHAARLGGVDKPGLVVGSSTMGAAVTSAAVAAGARRVVLVGPARADVARIASASPGGLAVVREDPPGAGPVPALRAGLAKVRSPWVAVLAADLPFLRKGDIRQMLAVASEAVPAGALMADDSGAAQWLAGCWQVARLRSALVGYGGSSLRSLLGPLNPVLIRHPARTGEPPPWLDCDTPADLAAARAWSAPPPCTTEPANEERQTGEHG